MKDNEEGLVETLAVPEKHAKTQVKKAEAPAAKAAPVEKKKAAVPVRILVEGGICIALAMALSFLKLRIVGAGGSIDLVMIPLIIFAMRSNAGWGIAAGLIFGTLKFFLSGGVAINWQSMLLDYSVAYAAVGLAGLFHNKYKQLPIASLVGCLARYAVHFVSGITIYRITGAEKILGITTSSPTVFSLLYNGTYMVPNTVLAVLICSMLVIPPETLTAGKEKK